MNLSLSYNLEADLATATEPKDSSLPGANGAVRRQLELAEMAERDKNLDAAYRYWESKREDGLLPARGDIDIIELRPVLKTTHMVDVTSDKPDEWTFRVVGSVVPESWDWSAGKPALAACPWPPYRDMLIEDYGAVRVTGVPLYQEVAIRVDWVRHSYGRVILPLADDGRTVTHVLVCVNLRDIPDLHV